MAGRSVQIQLLALSHNCTQRAPCSSFSNSGCCRLLYTTSAEPAKKERGGQRERKLNSCGEIEREREGGREREWGEERDRERQRGRERKGIRCQ